MNMSRGDKAKPPHVSKPERSAPDGLERRVLETARRNGLAALLLDEPLVVGVSGGMDSLALLHLLVALRGESAGDTLHVAHLEHGFRGETGLADACFVEQAAKELGIPSTVGGFDVPGYARRYHMTAEEAARVVRYSFLAQIAGQREATVTVAHNADDQAETVLMHFLRGSGLSGLAGMQPIGEVPVRSYGNLNAQGNEAGNMTVRVYRPLLHIWREEIAAYCREHGLNPRIDATNSDLSYRRNRIRHELIPYLAREYSPAIKAHLTALADLAASDGSLLKEITDAKWGEVANTNEQPGFVIFRAAEVASMPEGLRRRIVRKALGQLAGTLDGFTFEHVRRVVQLMSTNIGHTAVQLPHGLVAERTGDIAVLRRKNSETEEIFHQGSLQLWPELLYAGEWPRSSSKVELAGGWRLDATTSEASATICQPGDYVAAFDADALEELGPVVWRARKPGDFIEPLGMSGRKSLQDLLVDAKIPRRVRDMIPLLALAGGEGEILWVPGPGGRRSRRAMLTETTARVLCLRFNREEV